MKTVCATGPVVKGIDVSRWQPKFDFHRAKRIGVEFCFIKATEGVTVKDTSFQIHRRCARNAGLLVGAYHFFRPKSNPVIQAEELHKTIKDFPCDLPPVLDLEAQDSVAGSNILESGRIFLETLEALSGRRPIVYTGPYFFEGLKNPGFAKIYAKYPLWIAHYEADCPKVPDPWATWDFWQFTDKLPMKDHVGGLDGNWFNGTLEDLRVKFTV